MNDKPIVKFSFQDLFTSSLCSSSLFVNKNLLILIIQIYLSLDSVFLAIRDMSDQFTIQNKIDSDRLWKNASKEFSLHFQRACVISTKVRRKIVGKFFPLRYIILFLWYWENVDPHHLEMTRNFFPAKKCMKFK